MVNFDQYERVDKKEVGKGAFSKVYRVKTKNSSKLYAMKTILKQNLSSRDRLDLQNEIQIHQKLNHPHIIKFIDYNEDKNTFQILLENAPNGCLFYFVHHREGLPEFLALKFTYQLAQAVKYLHQRTIAHRDIKPENVLFDRNFNVKLCDFGWATEISTNTLRTSVCGTSEYMSPEILSKKLHSKKVDIWCLGVFLYELLMGRPPFEGRNQEELVNNILGKRIMIKKNISKETRNLLKGLLQRNEKKRFNIYQVLDHGAFKNYIQQFQQPLRQKHFNLLVRNFLIKSLGGSNMILPESFNNLDLKNYFQKQTTKFRQDEVPIDEEKEKEVNPEQNEEQMLARIKQQLQNKGINVDSLQNLKKVDSFRHNSNQKPIQKDIQNRYLSKNSQNQKFNSFTHTNKYQSQQNQNQSYQSSNNNINYQSNGYENKKLKDKFQNGSVKNFNTPNNIQRYNSTRQMVSSFNGQQQGYAKQDHKDIQSKQIEPPQLQNGIIRRKNQSFSLDQKPIKQHDWSRQIYQQKSINQWDQKMLQYQNDFINLKNQNKKKEQEKQIIPVKNNQIYKRDDLSVNSLKAIPQYSFQNKFPSQQKSQMSHRSNSMRQMHTPQFNQSPLIPQRQDNNNDNKQPTQHKKSQYSQSFHTNYRSNSLNTGYKYQTQTTQKKQDNIYDRNKQISINNEQDKLIQKNIKKESYHNVYGDFQNNQQQNKVQTQTDQTRQRTREQRSNSKRVISLSRYNSTKDIYSQLELKDMKGINLNQQVNQQQDIFQIQKNGNTKLHNIYSQLKKKELGMDKPRHYSLTSQININQRIKNFNQYNFIYLNLIILL